METVTRPTASIGNAILLIFLVVPSKYNIIHIVINQIMISPAANETFIQLAPFLKLGITISLALVFLPAVLEPLFPKSTQGKIRRFSKRNN